MIPLEKLTGNEVVEHYLKSLSTDMATMEQNDICILSDEKMNEVTELRVRGFVPENDIVESVSQIVVYTQCIEHIIKCYQSLEGFWEYIQEKILGEFGSMAALIVHGDKNKPHIHLIVKMNVKAGKIKLARIFNEVRFGKDGSADYITYPFSYYYESLLGVYEFFEKDTQCHDEKNSVSFTLFITSNFAEYLIKAKSIEACKEL